MTRIHRATVAFDMGDDVPHRILTRATEAGLESATRSLPSTGTVRGEGALGSATDKRRRVTVALTISGAAAEATWTRIAQEAFAAGFLAALGPHREGTLRRA